MVKLLIIVAFLCLSFVAGVAIGVAIVSPTNHFDVVSYKGAPLPKVTITRAPVVRVTVTARPPQARAMAGEVAPGSANRSRPLQPGSALKRAVESTVHTPAQVVDVAYSSARQNPSGGAKATIDLELPLMLYGDPHVADTFKQVEAEAYKAAFTSRLSLTDVKVTIDFSGYDAGLSSDIEEAAARRIDWNADIPVIPADAYRSYTYTGP